MRALAGTRIAGENDPSGLGHQRLHPFEVTAGRAEFIGQVNEEMRGRGESVQGAGVAHGKISVEQEFHVERVSNSTASRASFTETLNQSATCSMELETFAARARTSVGTAPG